MARLTRLYVPGMPQHLMLEARAGEAMFRDRDDLTALAETLRRASRDAGLAIHAYAFSPDAIHVLGTPRDADSVARTVQALGRAYVVRFNRRHQRTGPLWRGRYRATVIDPAQHLLFVSRLIESLAVDGAAPVDGPRRSSRPHHVGLAIDPLITDHALYWALGNTPFERQRVYRSLDEQPLQAASAAQALDAARKGWVFGDAAFQAQCMRLTDRRAAPLRRGRPKRETAIPN